MKIFSRRNIGSGMFSFPKPDRSALIRPPEEDAIEVDLGWAEGEFKNGRPFRIELWSSSYLSTDTYITVFFSSAGLEDASEGALAALLWDELSIELGPGNRISAVKMEDHSGKEMWSVTLLIQRDEESLVKIRIPFHYYQWVSKEIEEKIHSSPIHR